MDTLAVHIVVLPDEPMMARCFEENAKLLAQGPGPHEFNPESCVPHVSLAMGGIRSNALQIVQTNIQRIAQAHAALKLEADLTDHPIPNGAHVTEFTVKRTPEILALHEETLAALQEHLVQDATLDSLRQPPQADPITLHWLNGFAVHSSHERYSPHVTLGMGRAPHSRESIPFTASTIALFQLGNYCTCRKLFSAYPLAEKSAS